ncbi:YbaY family lipoprotein [Bartonella tamiae]|nr:YbaY family lipoprotein [Bartonella tamiae]
MKRRLFVGMTIGTAALTSLLVVSVVAMAINTTNSSITETKISTIKGNIILNQDVEMPAHAHLIVQLVDISQKEGPFQVISETSMAINTQKALDFKMVLNTITFEKDHDYALQARIVVGDILWFISDERTPISIFETANPYKIYLNLVGQNISSKWNVPTSVNGHEWQVEDIFNAGIIDSSHITINVTNEKNLTSDPTFVKYNVTGYGGCNRYSTSVMINEDEKTLKFATPAMTFMACAEAISQQEDRFTEMLMKTNSYNFDDIGRLFLKDSKGNYIARLIPHL